MFTSFFSASFLVKLTSLYRKYLVDNPIIRRCSAYMIKVIYNICCCYYYS